MKKVLIITLIVLILILGGVWAYLLLNGAPKNIADIRNNIFGAGGDTAPAPSPLPGADIPPEPAGVVRTIPMGALLVELTDRKVAGAVIVATTSTGFVRYMEKGTGNIFEISLETGVEQRISNQTIPYVVDALWSKTGDQLVFSTDIEGTEGETYLGTLTTNDTGVSIFDAEISDTRGENAMFSKDGERLFYTEQNTDGGTTGFVRSKKTGTASVLFSLPFRESIVLWDEESGTSSSAHYAVTKTALGYPGYIYQIGKGSVLKKIDESYTLSALRSGQHIIVNKNSGTGPYSLLIDTILGSGLFLNIQTLPEKCDGGDTVIWCGASASENVDTFPIDWYQGSISYADQLWRIDTKTGETKMITDPEPISREQLDIENLQVAEGGAYVIFRNKRNDSLWLYNPPQ